MTSHPLPTLAPMTITDTNAPADPVEDPPVDPPAADPVVEDPPANDPSDADKVNMTQAEFDDLLKKKLGQERKKLQKELEDATARAKMDDAERLAAEKADAEKAAADAIAKASEATIGADLKVAAVLGNVDPAKIDRFLKVADIDRTTLVDDEGAPDPKAIEKAIKKALTEWPEFAVPAGKNGRSGGEMGGPADRARPKTLEEAVAAQLAS